MLLKLGLRTSEGWAGHFFLTLLELRVIPLVDHETSALSTISICIKQENRVEQKASECSPVVMDKIIL